MLAKVTGWIGQPVNIPVYTHDGTPRGSENLSATPMSGIRQSSRMYNLVKLNTDPRDDRWVPTQYVNIVYCEQTTSNHAIPSGGQRENTSALSSGSGGRCER